MWHRKWEFQMDYLIENSSWNQHHTPCLKVDSHLQKGGGEKKLSHLIGPFIWNNCSLCSRIWVCHRGRTNFKWNCLIELFILNHYSLCGRIYWRLSQGEERFLMEYPLFVSCLVQCQRAVHSEICSENNLLIGCCLGKVITDPGW